MLQRYNSIYSRHGQIHNCNIKTLVCHSSYGFFWSWFSMKGAIIVKKHKSTVVSGGWWCFAQCVLWTISKHNGTSGKRGVF